MRPRIIGMVISVLKRTFVPRTGTDLRCITLVVKVPVASPGCRNP